MKWEIEIYEKRHATIVVEANSYEGAHSAGYRAVFPDVPLERSVDGGKQLDGPFIQYTRQGTGFEDARGTRVLIFEARTGRSFTTEEAQRILNACSVVAGPYHKTWNGAGSDSMSVCYKPEVMTEARAMELLPLIVQMALE